MGEPTEVEQVKTAADVKPAAYNIHMAELFAERDKHPVDSPERTAVVERIYTLWMNEGD